MKATKYNRYVYLCPQNEGTIFDKWSENGSSDLLHGKIEKGIIFKIVYLLEQIVKSIS